MVPRIAPLAAALLTAILLGRQASPAAPSQSTVRACMVRVSSLIGGGLTAGPLLFVTACTASPTSSSPRASAIIERSPRTVDEVDTRVYVGVGIDPASAIIIGSAAIVPRTSIRR